MVDGITVARVFVMYTSSYYAPVFSVLYLKVVYLKDPLALLYMQDTHMLMQYSRYQYQHPDTVHPYRHSCYHSQRWEWRVTDIHSWTDLEWHRLYMTRGCAGTWWMAGGLDSCCSGWRIHSTTGLPCHQHWIYPHNCMLCVSIVTSYSCHAPSHIHPWIQGWSTDSHSWQR